MCGVYAVGVVDSEDRGFSSEVLESLALVNRLRAAQLRIFCVYFSISGQVSALVSPVLPPIYREETMRLTALTCPPEISPA
jgi:hypothetical protein